MTRAGTGKTVVVINLLAELTKRNQFVQYVSKKAAPKIKEELADVINYCVLMADACGLDIDEIVQEKIRINNEKYPVEKAMYMSTENSVNRSLKTRSLLTKFGTCSIAATGAVTILLLFRSRFHCYEVFLEVCRNRLPYQSDKLCM